MEVYKLHELYVMAVCTLSGVFVGAFFHFVEAFKREIGKKSYPVFDFLFWVGASVIFYIGIHYSNNAKIRWFEFVFLAVGIYLYFLLLGKYAFKFFEQLLKVFFFFLCKIKALFFKILSFAGKLMLPFKNAFFEKKSKILFAVLGKTFDMKNKLKKSGKNISEKN